MNHYEDFKQRFKLLVRKNRHLVVNTLSNIFTMRLIGNKTHGDLAEIGLSEFINQFMYDYKSDHVGKDRFRAKEHEEDIMVTDEIKQVTFPISLKAYGVGPLQLSTDSQQKMFPLLEGKRSGTKGITDSAKIAEVFSSAEFRDFADVNVMPLIYDEAKKHCNIMVFDHEKARANTDRIIYIKAGKKFDHESGKVIARAGRKHPVFVFVDKMNNYVCEVRYGGATANALQRGLWTDTAKAAGYFDSITDGWIDYSHNLTLIKLFKLALNSSERGHETANAVLQKDIDNLKQAG